MKSFLIEARSADPHMVGHQMFQQFFVKAKTYEEACGKVAKVIGNVEWKLNGTFEAMETDKSIMLRTT